MLRRSLIVLAVVLAVAVALVAIAYRDTNHPALRRVEIPVRGLSGDVTILHVSDLHGRSFGDNQSEIVSLLGESHYDAVVLTGDYTSGSSAGATAVVQLVEVLQERTPIVFGVLGNHDDSEVLADMLDAGVVFPGSEAIPLPEAKRVYVVDSDEMAAVGPVTTEGLSEATVALRHVPPSDAHLEEAGKASPEPLIYLSGHTHGGQVRIPLIGAVRSPVGRHFSAYSAEEWRTESFPELRGIQVQGIRESGDDTVYISRGLGTAFLPFRLFCRSELTEIHLVPAED